MFVQTQRPDSNPGARGQVKGQLDLMRRACGELESCDDFVRLLQEVLQTGNRLNEGTMRGAAAGA